MASMTMSMATSTMFLLSTRVSYFRNLIFFILISKVSQMAVCGPTEAMGMTMAAPMLMEQTEANQVNYQPHGAHPQDHLGLMYGLWLIEPL